LTLSLALSFSVTTFAASVNQNSDPKTVNSTIYTTVNPTYTVTVPANLTVNLNANSTFC
jgi:hypothetical protein